MLDFNQAWTQHIASAPLLAKIETLPLEQCLNRIAADTLTAPHPVPAQRLSAMDGYALNSQDYIPNHLFSISQRIPAGTQPPPLNPKTAARIFTGAPIPEGADVVIPQEQAQQMGTQVLFHPQTVIPNRHIRQIGENLQQGEVVVAQGTRLKPQTLGLLASIGIAQLKVYRPLNAVTFTTGNELIDPGQPLKTGQIYNANRFVLNGLLQKLGVTVIDLGQIDDTLSATQSALEQAAQLGDLIITTGGVSVGDEDHIKPAVKALGHLHLWKVKMKPGKPMAFGEVQGTPFIGLPGNPVASFVAFHLFTQFFIRKANGENVSFPDPIWAKAAFQKTQTTAFLEFPRARLIQQNHESWVEPFPNQGSAALNSIEWAEGLAAIPPNTSIQTGDSIAFYPFSHLFPF